MATEKITIEPNRQTADFIRRHIGDDVRTLAFRKADNVDMAFALQQIAGRQKARKKLPHWYATDGLIYPPAISMEQCSSEQTARYKASLLGRSEGGCMVDLTGGFGVDFSYMAPHYLAAVYVERQEALCRIAEHNFKLLGLGNAKVVCDDCANYIDKMPCVDVVFIDPARRDANGGRTFAISDCTPDVLSLLPKLLEKARRIIVKLSPMLDWHKAVADFRGHVAEVHIIAVNNECKELLLVVVPAVTDSPRVVCRNDDSEFVYYGTSEAACVCAETAGALSAPNSSISKYNIMCGGWLFVPNAAIMKAGCFRQLAARYGIPPLSENSHLFVSPFDLESFPGNHYRIVAVTSMNKKELKSTLQGITNANISVRNFPLSADELRKRLKMRDGGNIFIFATTLSDGAHVLIVCQSL